MRLVHVLAPLALLVAGCTGASPGADADPVTQQAVSGGNGGGGGSVRNTAPTVTAFTSDRTTGENDGAFAVVFSGTLFDANAEAQVATLRLAAEGPAALSSNRSVTAADRSATVEPTSYGADGWKVWTGTERDGTLHFRHRQAFPLFSPAGAYAFRLSVTDQPGETGVSAPIAITLTRFALVSVSGAPVDAAGIALPGASWGGWTADAGATDVQSVNYLKLVNDGDQPDARIVVDFTETAFRGASDANFTVPIDGNVQFAVFEDVTPALTAPAEGGFTFGAASATGSATVQFTGKGHVAYVAYRLVKLPDVLPVQAYSSTFTVTDL